MIRTLKHTWHDPVTRWELRYLESQHRKPRRWWLALVALPGITAAVIAFFFVDVRITTSLESVLHLLTGAVMLAYMVGAWIAVSISAAVLAKRDRAIMNEQVILTGVTARRLAAARVIALWRHHRRLWLLLIVLRGALAYGTMIFLIEYPHEYRSGNVSAAFAAFYYQPPYHLGVSVCYDNTPGAVICGSRARAYPFVRVSKGSSITPVPRFAAISAPVALLVMTAADSLLICTSAALIARIMRSLTGLTMLTMIGSRLAIAALALIVMNAAPWTLYDLSMALFDALSAAGTRPYTRLAPSLSLSDQLDVQDFYGSLGKAPRDLAIVRRVLNHSFDGYTYNYYDSTHTYTKRLILDGVQLTASSFVDGVFPIANLMRLRDSTRYHVFAMFTVVGSAVLYLILIGAQMRIAVWIVRRRGALR